MASKVYGNKYINTLIAVLFIVLDYVVIVTAEQSAFLLCNFILSSNSLHIFLVKFLGELSHYLYPVYQYSTAI